MSTNCLFGFSLFGEKLRAQWAPGGQKEDEKSRTAEFSTVRR